MYRVKESFNSKFFNYHILILLGLCITIIQTPIENGISLILIVLYVAFKIIEPSKVIFEITKKHLIYDNNRIILSDIISVEKITIRNGLEDYEGVLVLCRNNLSYKLNVESLEIKREVIIEEIIKHGIDKSREP